MGNIFNYIVDDNFLLAFILSSFVVILHVEAVFEVFSTDLLVISKNVSNQERSTEPYLWKI